LSASNSRWWFPIFVYVHPIFGEDETMLRSIFFKWVGSTTTFERIGDDGIMVFPVDFSYMKSWLKGK